MRDYLRRNAVVAAVVIGGAACVHAVAREHGVVSGNALLALTVAVVVAAFGIAIALHAVSVLSPRTSPLIGAVVPFALLVIAAGAALAHDSEDPDGAGIVIVASAVVAASGLLGLIASDLSTAELIVLVPFAIEGIALARMITTDAYGAPIVAGAALLGYAVVTARRPMMVRKT